MADKSVRSEDVLGQKWDKCLSDTVIKVGWGIGFGVITSFLFFSRRPWPVVFGGAFGLGMGCSNCGNELNQPYTQYMRKIKLPEGDQANGS